MKEIVTIDKSPVLPVSSDYYKLRKKATDYLQQVGTDQWTDFNLHDPGITILEMLAYGITELSYRQNLPIEDLLAIDVNGNIDGDSQGIFTPYEALTISPWTIKDYRKFLIDLPGVRNAWLFVRENEKAEGEKTLYIDCKESALSYMPTHHTLLYKGLYDVHVELEDNNLYGDLNSGSIAHQFTFSDSNTNSQNAFVELRLQPWNSHIPTNIVVDKITGSSNPSDVTPIVISGNIADNSDIPTGGPNEQAFRNALRRTLYTTFYVHLVGGGNPILMSDVPIVLHFYGNARMEVTLNDIKQAIIDSTSSGPLQRYYDKMTHVGRVLQTTNYMLNEYRNYCEDFVSISTAQIEDFAICCDIEAEAEYDLEKLQAEIYYSIFNYMNPAINFYSWQELINEGEEIDEIFNGPQTVNGFIKDEELNNSELRSHLYTSDLINIIMDIPGVAAVRNFSIVRIDAHGRRAEAQPWQMVVSKNNLPRFYTLGSKIQFYKNGLPFVTDAFELNDTIAAIKAQKERPKLNKYNTDIEMPKGRYLPLGDYYPLMYTLPPLYNVSPAGPMPPINNLRKAETKQLKAYLMVYEQVYANWNIQIEKLNQFFSTSTASLSNTYATKLIDNGDLLDVQDVYSSGFTESFLNEIGESLRELYDRKNRTYNHLLARLGENNNDYLLLNNQLDGKLIDPENVIDNKRELIKSFSQNTYNKARSLNYMADSNFWSSTVNMGLIGKLSSLLGLQSVMDALTWQYVPNSGLGNYQLRANYSGLVFEMNIWLTVEQAPHPFITEVYVAQVANDLSYLFNSNSGVRYSTEIAGQQFRIVASEPDGTLLWKLAEFFPTSELEDEQGEYDEEKAENFINGVLAERRDAVLEFSTRNTIIPIENLLLRPRTNGEDVFNICVPNNCEFCGDEDPYSFRMTFVLCGDDGYWGSNLAYRAYAENAIRKEVPAHIVSRICWLSKAEFTNVFTLFQNWLRNEVAHESDYVDVVNARKLLVAKLNNMRSMYPEATLHDCEDGNDNNRVFLGKTVISI